MISFPFHILSVSPWPFLVSLSLFDLLSHSFLLLYSNSSHPFTFLRILLFFFFLFAWFFDIFLDSLEGSHPSQVSLGFFFGYSLFILSELLIFFSLFYSYFYHSLLPDPSLGCIWPPLGISPLDYISIPLFNSFLLLSSGISLTITHNLLLFPSSSYWLFSILFLGITLLLGFTFSFFQYLEYYSSSFSFFDSLFSNSFYILTSWHGIHVLIGSLFLFISLISLFFPWSSSPLSLDTPVSHYSSFKWFFFSSIYWHLVDLIWFFIFFLLYFSPSLSSSL